MATAMMNPRATAMAGLLSLNVDSAFELFSLPTPGTRVVRLERQRSAWAAAAAGVALLVQRENRNPAARQIGPDFAIRPVRERADLAQRLAAGQPEIVNQFKIGAGRRLLPAQRREPGVKSLEA